LKVVQEMLGHSSIVLTADTYTSVLPEVAHTAAEKTAAHPFQAAGVVPGTTRRRGRAPVRGPRAVCGRVLRLCGVLVSFGSLFLVRRAAKGLTK
jgi:hypothetical protein